jgi:hypothetical protein
MQVGMRQDSRGQERKDTFVTQKVEVKVQTQDASGFAVARRGRKAEPINNTGGHGPTGAECQSPEAMQSFFFEVL